MLPEVKAIGSVVVCEDDPGTRELLCANLRADRFDPLPAAGAEEALRRCRTDAPDAMILDLGLPDAPGLDVIREIRGADGPAPSFDAALPIVVVSGFGSDSERVRGLREGADDYLVKPFHYEELVTRLEKLLERRRVCGEPRRGPIGMGSLRVDPARRAVTADGAPVELTSKEYELLLVLISDPERVFTKQELLESIWGYHADARTRTLDSHASRLRRKLDPESRRWVHNVWGVGYRLAEGSS